jgi:hypothetical protein
MLSISVNLKVIKNLTIWVFEIRGHGNRVVHRNISSKDCCLLGNTLYIYF